MKKLLVYNILFSLALWALGQDVNIEFKHYSRRDGLNSTITKAITQDHDGFLWVCHRTGIERFNGYDFESFNTTFADSSINLLYYTIQKGPKSSLLIGTENNGLIEYFPRENRIHRFQFDENDPRSISANYVTTIYIDSKERIWVGTWFGLNLFDPTTGSFERFPFDAHASNDIFNYSVIEKITEDAHGNLWLATWGSGLHQFNPFTKKFLHFEKINSQDKSNLWIKDLAIGQNGKLYLASVGNGLLLFDIENHSFNKIEIAPDKKSVGFDRMIALHFYDKNTLWIGTEEGLIIYNTQSNKTIFINDQGIKSSSLQNKIVDLIFEDNHNGVWIGAGGLSYFNKKASKFDLYEHNPTSNSISDNEILAILEIDTATIWISTAKGINEWNRTTGTFRLINPFPAQVHILKKWKQIVYAAAPQSGIYKYDLVKKRTNAYNVEEDIAHGLLGSHAIDMEVDHKGNLWIGGLKGLTVLRQRDNKFTHFIEDLSYSKGLKSISVSNVAITANGEIWCLNHKNLMRLTENTLKFLKETSHAGIINDTTQYGFERIDQFNIAGHLLVDNTKVYLNTSKGLAVYDQKTNESSIINAYNTFGSGNIKSIVLDDQNGVWLGTDNGLVYANLITKEVTSFYEEDGLQSNLFSTNAAIKTFDGRIIIGGNNGFNVIQPNEIELNPYVPPVFITDLLIFNQSVPVKKQNDAGTAMNNEFLLDKDPAYLQDLVLSHDQNSITFEISSLNFLYPEKNEIAYYLEGFEKNWNYLKNRRYISYNDIPEGEKLTLLFKGSNNNGIWSLSPNKLNIFIEPPIYDTTWFKVVMSTFLVVLAYLAYRVRISSLKMAQNRLSKEVELRTKEIELQKREIEEKNESLTAQSEHLRLQNQNIELFSKIGQQITSSIEIENIFLETFHQITRIIQCEHISIGKIMGADDQLSYWEMSQGKVTEQVVSLSTEKRLSALSFHQGIQILSNDIKNEIRNYLDNPPQYYFDSDFHSVIYIPLISHTKVPIGILVAKSTHKNAFNDAHVALLENISTYMTIALENSRSYEQIKIQSEQLKEIDRIKTKFYTNISHEFRTPLSLIIGPADEIMKNPSLSIRDREYLDIIVQNARRMLRLVTQVLDLSKLEDGVLRLEVSKGDINESLRSIMDSFRFIAEKKKIGLEFKTNTNTILGYYDQDKIEKIIYNLINNAFKYTEEHGEILLRTELKGSPSEEKFITIVVIDTGIGIPENELGQIFNTYFRVDNDLTKKEYGAGIGLALVKKLVQLHHGTIEVNSSENQGTTFVVNIPLSAEAYQASEIFEQTVNRFDPENNMELVSTKLADQRDYSIKHIGNKKILLVEDNEDLLQFMVNSLNQSYEIITAMDGSEAYNLVERNRPDLIVSDVMMPKMNGFQLCRQIKENTNYSDIPVILLTAKNSQESQVEGLTHGADVYLPKPVNIAALKLRIENQLIAYENIRNKYESKLVMNVADIELGDEHKNFLIKVTDVLEKNITNKDVNIDLFAHELGMSRTLLYEKIKKATGQSMGTFIKTNRLNYSLKLLLENHLNTSELAYQVGFSDPKYFSKCFRRQFGKTPKEYLQSKLNDKANH